MHYIDDFFQGKLSGEEVKMFEEKIVRDPEFAEEVSFYLSSKQSARDLVDEEKKKRFKALYGSSNGFHKPNVEGKVIRFKYALRVAMIAAVFTAVYLTVFRPDGSSPNNLANNYLKENYKDIPVKMGRGDERQRASDLYNSGNYKASLSAFEDIIKKDTTSFYAMEYAGLSALQLADFDMAVHYFKLLENYPGLLSSRGVFLQALTFMKRSQKGDKEEAEQLLKRVVAENLDGKETAEKWLKKF